MSPTSMTTGPRGHRLPRSCSKSTWIEGRNLYIALEAISRPEANFFRLSAEGLALAKELNRPNIRLLVDFYHLSIVGAAADYLQHTHLANPIGRAYPKARDQADYRSFIRALQNVGYRGGLSVEGFSEDFETDAREALQLLRAMVRA